MCEHLCQFGGLMYCSKNCGQTDNECYEHGVNDDGQECCWYEPQEKEDN